MFWNTERNDNMKKDKRDLPGDYEVVAKTNPK